MKRVLSMSGMVLAVIGVLFCLVLGVSGWYGRAQVNAAVGELLPILDRQLDQNIALLQRANDVLGSTNDRLGTARTRVASIVDSSTESVAAVTSTLNDVVQTVITPIQNVRTQVSALRSSVNLFAAAFNGLPSVLGIPDIPTERLEALDERATAIDAQIDSIANTVVTTQENLAETRARIVTALDSLQEALTGLSGAAQTTADTFSTLQQRLPELQGDINLWMTLLALALTLLGLCGSALFANLFYSAFREWELGALHWVRVATTTTTTATRSESIGGAELMTTTVTVAESKSKRPAEAPSVHVPAIAQEVEE